ncbi:MAG: hypothetical protein RQ894_00285 [Candidatus Pacebacteria bacterium]|jgi:hypothetical protein|nr:hypothetical protein [Candidatus Paceibacterota bacterium]
MINFLLGFLTADFVLTISLFLNLKFFYNKSYPLFLILGLIDLAIIIFLLYVKNAKEK